MPLSPVLQVDSDFAVTVRTEEAPVTRPNQSKRTRLVLMVRVRLAAFLLVGLPSVSHYLDSFSPSSLLLSSSPAFTVPPFNLSLNN